MLAKYFALRTSSLVKDATVDTLGRNDIRIARDEAVNDDKQCPTDPPCIGERKRLRKHADAEQ